MKKPLKAMSAASLAAIFASTSLVPVAAFAAEDVVAEISYVVYEQDGKLISVTMDEFETALLDGEFDLKTENIKYLQLSNDQFYLMDDFETALLDTDTAEEAVNMLAKQDGEDVEVVEGYYDEEGNVVAKDEQPEDRLNETFFYNVA